MQLFDLLEGISENLFHSTMIQNAINILQNDEFVLQSDFAKSSESKAKKPMFFLSTARSRLGSYLISSDKYVSNFSVLFHLNGKKLSNNYSGKAVDYWGQSFKNPETKTPLSDEMEDRIFSPTRSIPATKYITKIDVYANVTPRQQGMFDTEGKLDKSEYLLKLYQLASKHNIEIRFFGSKSNFIAGKNPTPTKEVLKKLHDPKGFIQFEKNQKRYKSSFGNTIDKFIRLANLLLKNKRQDIDYTPTQQEILYISDFNSQYRRQDIKDGLLNDMHNFSKDKKMVALRDLMKLYKTNNIHQLFDAVVEKIQKVNNVVFD